MSAEIIHEMFAASCAEQLADIEEAVLNLERVSGPDRPRTVDAIMRAAHTIKGDAASLGASSLSSLCHKVETALEAVKDGRLPSNEKTVGELLRAFDRIRVLSADSQNLGEADVSRDLIRLDVLLDEAGAPRKDGSNPDGDAGSGSRDEERYRQRINAVTLPSEELDVLLDRVGELGIVHARVAAAVRNLGARELEPLTEEMERLGALLRDQTLGMRMLPLNVCFAKYRRLVRDVCARTGKRAALVLVGENVELDKTMIERLNTPLVHLLRNAVDHGVEPPEIRSRLGKPEEGRVTLTAVQEGSEVRIVVGDDGAGVDVGRLRAKAEAMGLLSPDARLSPEETLDLIFLPGLTTAEAVGEFSGRGVGMDAVRDGVRALRGRVGVASEPGRGASFDIRLPASLAIIDCLTVRVGGETYFFHLDYVEQCLEAAFSERGPRKGAGLLDVRGNPLPLLYLRDFFRLDGQTPDRSHVIVVRTVEGRFGVVADAVVGRAQAVLKPLGPAIGSVPGVLGATVDENGDMALILDIPTLARTALAFAKTGAGAIAGATHAENSPR